MLVEWDSGLGGLAGIEELGQVMECPATAVWIVAANVDDQCLPVPGLGSAPIEQQEQPDDSSDNQGRYEKQLGDEAGRGGLDERQVIVTDHAAGIDVVVCRRIDGHLVGRGVVLGSVVHHGHRRAF